VGKGNPPELFKLGPMRRGPEGGEVEVKGRILKEAPESTRKRLPDC